MDEHDDYDDLPPSRWERVVLVCFFVGLAIVAVVVAGMLCEFGKAMDEFG
jgi:hypothetical protein